MFTKPTNKGSTSYPGKVMLPLYHYAEINQNYGQVWRTYLP